MNREKKLKILIFILSILFIIGIVFLLLNIPSTITNIIFVVIVASIGLLSILAACFCLSILLSRKIDKYIEKKKRRKENKDRIKAMTKTLKMKDKL